MILIYSPIKSVTTMAAHNIKQSIIFIVNDLLEIARNDECL